MLTARITFLFINWIFIYNIIVIAILTLTSAIDFKVPTRHTLVLETKYSIVSFIRNLKYQTTFVNSEIFYSDVVLVFGMF